MVRDGIAAYSLDFLIDSGLSKDLQDVYLESKKKFSHLFVDHSWCELAEEDTIIDYLPSIKLPEGVLEFNKLLLINATNQGDKAEYLPIGREFKFGNSKLIYTPKAGPRIGSFHLPRITKLIK